MICFIIKSVVLSIMFFCLPLSAMEYLSLSVMEEEQIVANKIEPLFLTDDVFNKNIFSFLGLQSIKNFAQTCTAHQSFFQLTNLFTVPLESVCWNEFKDNDNFCRKALICSAQVKNLSVFKVLFNYNRE